METAITYSTKILVGAIGLLDAYLGRQATESILDDARARYVAEGRPPTDEELLANVEVAKAINDRIQQA